ncbi:hypothetical protein ABZ464_38740 [Streptomyces sp. NPDC005820]|uniref:hypothetical protein n=1 Tax=Streptomyces sp. NPDC005820 TaxID=3157069 RepID=UPI0033CBFF3F
MSGQEERGALDPPIALYDHAVRAARESADGLPPPHGHSLRGPSRPGTAPALPYERARAAVREALDPLPTDSDALHRRFDALGIRARHRTAIRAAVAELPLPQARRDAARSLGRQLVRTGTSVPAVLVGLALLVRLGEAADVPCLCVLALTRELGGAAIEALDAVDRPRAAFSRLALDGRDELRPLVRALRAGDRQTVLAELEALPTSPRSIGSTVARSVTEATLLPRLLDEHPSRTTLLARAGRLLVRMARDRHDTAELLACRDAPRLYESVVGRARLLPPTLEHHATLLSLALDLSSGPGVLLDWPQGRRAALLETLGRLLAEPRWAALADAVDGDEPEQRRRARWIRRTGRRPFTLPAPPGRLRIEVVEGDPVDRLPVETRVLVDGRPLVPAVFRVGPAHGPERLQDMGGLRAGPAPREVQLAEASCTEGCCGALYVTIRRAGDRVVWENWRRPGVPGAGRNTHALPPERFDALAYDAEIARAEADLGWSWPARAVARLIKGELGKRPELLRRWDMGRGWISTGPEDPDTVEVGLWYTPGLGAGKPDGDPLLFRWAVPDDGTPPEAQAAAAVRRLTEEDPKTYARLVAGSRRRAEELGFTWPYDT